MQSSGVRMSQNTCVKPLHPGGIKKCIASCITSRSSVLW